MSHILLFLALLPSPQAPLATVTLISESSHFTPGDTTWMALAFEIPEGWHLYWNGLNDSGLEPTLELNLPPGFSAGALWWPHPTRKVIANLLVDHIYERHLILPFPVYAPPDAPLGRIREITAKVTWLICKQACIAEKATVARDLPIGRDAIISQETSRPWIIAESIGIRAARALVPKEAPEGLVQGEWTDNTLKLSVPGATHLEFFPHRERALPLKLLEQGAQDGPELSLDFEATTVSLGVSGVLEVRTAEGPTWYHIRF